jgi:Holliday junction resolvase RusA-like endonuclease
MLFIVKGRPASVQSSRQNKARWAAEVATAAKLKCPAPLAGNGLRIKITFYYNALPDFDSDNISKPICDALNGITYADDHQLADRVARRRDMGQPYVFRGIDPELAAAIAEGQEFVSVEIDDANLGEL